VVFIVVLYTITEDELSKLKTFINIRKSALTGKSGNSKTFSEFITVNCDGSGNVTAKSSTTYPDCTWTYERYY
jgi:hypothetical protein